MLAPITIWFGRDYLSFLSPAKMLRLLAASFLFGVASAVNYQSTIDPIYFFASAVVTVILLIGLWRHLAGRVVLIILFGLLLGWWRWTAVNMSVADDIGQWQNQQLTWRGRVTVVDERIDQIKLTISAQQAHSGRELQPVSGLVLVTVPTTGRWQIADRVEVSCRLVAPESRPDFDYQRYLRRFNIQTICQYAQVRSLGQSDNFSLFRLIGQIKVYFADHLDRVIGEPAGGIVQGMVLGSAHRIDPELYQLFVQLGMSHIIAISGSHITLIIALLLTTLIYLGLNRRQVLPVLLVIIGGYVILVGAPASALRAAVMAVIVLFGQQLGRAGSTATALLLAAAGLVFFDPYALLFDVGFQLSFLAVIGLVYLAPLIDRRLEWVIKWKFFRELVALTLAAQVLTAPLIIFYFTRFSLSGVIANIVVLPIVPLLMVLSIIMVLLAPVIPLVAMMIGLAVSLLVDYWTAAALLCAQLFGTNLAVPGLSLGWLVVIYIVMFGWLFHWRRSWYNY